MMTAVAQVLGPYAIESEWWMEPGEYRDGGLICRTEHNTQAISTYCRHEPWLIEKVWDWNFEHLVQSPVVWAVVGVLAFVASAVYVGLNWSKVVDHGCYGLWVFLGTLGAVVAVPLGWAMLALSVLGAVWFGIFWLTSKGGRAALLKRQAKAKARRQELMEQSEMWRKLADSVGSEESDYQAAALAAARSLKEQAEGVRS